MSYTIVLDAGHGGSDTGATYEDRLEKDDNLRLVLAIGSLLENTGVNVEYTRVSDVYNTPYEKAMMANNADADLFISIHRNNANEDSNHGVETLVFDNSGIKAMLAQVINKRLEKVGFKNLGIESKPNLVLLKLSNMPTTLVNVGSINSEADNNLYDNEFDEIAGAIADSILETIEMNKKIKKDLYRVQVGAYNNKDKAYKIMQQLQREGFQSFIILTDGLYRIQVGAFEMLENAIRMEQSLRAAGYCTYIVTQ